MRIKNFEQYNLNKESFDILHFHHLLRDIDMYPEKFTNISFEFIKEKTDKFVGKGFYEKVYERSKDVYNKLSKVSGKIQLLEGLAENRFEKILKQYKKEIRLMPVLSQKGKGDYGYNGFRHFGKKLDLKSILCNILNDFIWNTLHGSWSQDLRTNSEAFQVNDEKWNVLNIPKNKDLYGDAVGRELIEYIENFDPYTFYVPSIKFEVGNKTDFFSVNPVSIKECDEIFEEFLKLMKKVLKVDLEPIIPISHKYHQFVSEYEINLLIK